MADTPVYALLPVDTHERYPAECVACLGTGVTGARYEMSTDSGTIIRTSVHPSVA